MTDPFPKPGAHHKRMKPKYSPNLTEAERKHKGRIKRLPCYGCGAGGINEAHHTLLPITDKRWRRDHRWLLPLCPECHRGTNGVHGMGNEANWLASVERAPEQAETYMRRLWEESQEARK